MQGVNYWDDENELMLILGSAGSIEVFKDILEQLPEEFSTPIVFVTHIGRNRQSILAHALSRYTHLKVKPVGDGDLIQSGHAYTCIPDYNVEFCNDRFLLTPEDTTQRFLPSFDKAIKSAEKAFNHRLTIIMLTGMLDDGVQALQAIYPTQSKVIVQEPFEAKYPSMPMMAILRDHPDAVMSVNDISQYLSRHAYFDQCN